MLWPNLSSVNLLLLRKIIASYNITYELYDDDQVYLVFSPSVGSVADEAHIVMESFFFDTCQWLTNMQKVNEGKTKMSH